MPRVRARSRMVPLLAAFALMASACSMTTDADAGDVAASSPDTEGQLSVAIASFDLAVGDDRRLLAGVLSSERELLAFGDVHFQLGHLGDEPGGETDLTQSVTATFLPVPGSEPEGSSDAPRFLSGETGSGVYAGRIDFDEAGFWGLRVVAETEDGQTLEGQTTFSVEEEQQVPGVGDPAPRSTNFTIADVEAGDIPPAALDSRAGGENDTIPDPQLHDAVVADVIEEGRPVVVGVMTPVYCVSRFCGPLANVMAELAETHEDVAEFVHLEVWRDFDEQLINDAAADWIIPGGDQTQGREPWVFLVDGTGTITHRWDNVADIGELEAALEAL